MLLAGGGTSARADAVISLPASVTYLNQTLPDTLGGNGYVFIAAEGGIIVCNVAGQQLTTVDAGDGIGALALSPDGATLYASVNSGANAGSVTAITVSSIASGPVKQTFYPLAAGDQPGSLAAQSGKVWVAYSTTVAAVTTVAIGAINLADNGTFEPAAAPGTWDKPVELAADPRDTGVLVAVSYDSPAEAATYNTATDPATPIAAQGALGAGGNACSYLGEVAVVPNGTGFAAGCDGPASVQDVQPADITTGVAAYFANGGGTSQAIAVAVDADGSRSRSPTGPASTSTRRTGPCSTPSRSPRATRRTRPTALSGWTPRAGQASPPCPSRSRRRPTRCRSSARRSCCGRR